METLEDLLVDDAWRDFVGGSLRLMAMAQRTQLGRLEEDTGLTETTIRRVFMGTSAQREQYVAVLDAMDRSERFLVAQARKWRRRYPAHPDVVAELARASEELLDDTSTTRSELARSMYMTVNQLSSLTHHKTYSVMGHVSLFIALGQNPPDIDAPEEELVPESTPGPRVVDRAPSAVVSLIPESPPEVFAAEDLELEEPAVPMSVGESLLRRALLDEGYRALSGPLLEVARAHAPDVQFFLDGALAYRGALAYKFVDGRWDREPGLDVPQG